MPPNQDGSCQFIKRKIVDDEDENMSPTQSERNDEPRRDNFTAHEQGTKSNNETAREQALQISQCGKMCKPGGEKKRLKAELPENVHGMRSAVHAHCLFLLKVRDEDFSALQAPPSTEEREIAIQMAGHLGHVPKDVFNEPSTQVQSQGFQSYCKNELHKLGLKQFTWDWESSWQDPFNKLMSMVFYHTLSLALFSTEYHHYCGNKDHNNYGVVAALMEQYFTYLKREWKSIQKDEEYLVKEGESKAHKDLSKG
ncbi:hypothetical protein O181_041169 [Austropuccinia psidii MF-1]|uniref:Uncharacterized protein n=1 Tax=Austropuccinia psidii MF-1 TaxID=1389203 RepID=A0A9Q3DDP3_9BASI|nr:hypothetical protein [Austropuccinia psidii MF-1]